MRPTALAVSQQIQKGWNNLLGITCLECRDISSTYFCVLNGTGVRLRAELAHQICSNSLYHIIYCLSDNSILQNFASQEFRNLHRTAAETGLFPQASANVQRAVFWEQCSKAPVQGEWCGTHMYGEFCSVIAYIRYRFQRVQQLLLGDYTPALFSFVNGSTHSYRFCLTFCFWWGSKLAGMMLPTTRIHLLGRRKIPNK